jgi:hypothetical protein
MNSLLVSQSKNWETPFSKLIPFLLAISFGVTLGMASLFSSWAGLLLALVFNGLLIALFRPILLCYFVIAGVALTSGMGRGQIIPMLIPNEAILFASVALTLPLILAKRLTAVRVPAAIIISIIILVGGTMLLPIAAYYFRGIPFSFSDIIKITAPVQYMILAGLFLYIPTNDDERYHLIIWMMVCCGIVAVVGLLQAAGIGSVISFLQKWYPSNHSLVSADLQRVTSLMGVWNGLGTFLMMNMLLARSFRHLLRTQRDRVVVAVVFLLCFACLLASGSYAGLIGLAMGFALIGFFDRRGVQEIKVILLGLAVGIIPLRSIILYRFGLQYRDGGILPQTFVYRLYIWRDIFGPVLKKDWLWGYGPTLTGLAWLYPESIYYSYLLTGGIFSLFSHFIWLFITIGWLWKRLYIKDEMVKTIAAFLVTMLIVLSVMGITNEVFTFSGTVDYFWILLGLIIGKEGLCLPQKIK